MERAPPGNRRGFRPRNLRPRSRKSLPTVKWEVTSTTKKPKTTCRWSLKSLWAMSIIPPIPQITVDIQLALTTPANATGPVPVIMDSDSSALPGRAGRGACAPTGAPGPTWQQQVLAKGWGYAILSPTAFRPTTARTDAGHHRPGQQGPAPQAGRLGRLRAWAWGASRASIISRPTRPSTPSTWASKDTRATAKRRSSRWPTIRVSRSPLSALRAKAV